MLKRIFGAALAVIMVFGVFTLFPVDAHAASDMKASEACLNMIKETEGFRAIPYWDYSQWTVGFGSACPAEHLERYKAEGIPVDEANALFEKEIAKFETTVNNFQKKHKLNFTQGQFDALVSLTYNLGSSYLTNTSSTIAAAILSGATDNELIFAFSVYCMAGGEFMPGLMRRRMAEANMFLNGEYDDYAPKSYCYVHYDANGGERDASAQAYDSNMPAVPMSKPTKTGYTFLGWYTAPTGGVKVSSLDEGTHGMTLYAHWEKLVTTTENATKPASGIKVKVTKTAVHTRSGPGTGHSLLDNVFFGDTLTITGTTAADDSLWGFFGTGWIDLRYTNYFEIVKPDEEKPEVSEPLLLPLYATVIDSKGVVVYNGPHTTYPQKRTLAQNTQILLLQSMIFIGKEWVAYDGGWLQLNSSILIHDENTLAHSFQATSNTLLIIRSGPSTSYGKVGNMTQGSSQNVYAVVQNEGAYWGRIAKGWVNLGYTDFNVSKLDYYRNHVYGAWYKSASGTCVTPGQEQRDCKYCDHSETRNTQLGSHVFGQWYITKAPTTTAYGEERRDCTACDHYETRRLEKLTGSSKIYATVTCDTLRVRSGPGTSYSIVTKLYKGDVVEVLELKMVGTDQWGRISDGWILLTGNTKLSNEEDAPHTHTYGNWYVTKAPTTTEYGEERRDCTGCDHFETRRLEKLTVTTKTYATVTCDILRVRSGPGTSYSIVTKLYKGNVVEVLEQKKVGTDQWGRISNGWIMLTGNTKLSTQEDSHTHTYGNWYVTKAPTATEYGEERRDCTGCDHYETRKTDKLTTVTRVYATITCSSLSIRQGAGTGYTRLGYYYKGEKVEILEQVKVGTDAWGRTAKGWICLTGYTTLETVTETPSDAAPKDRLPVAV